MIQWTPIPVGTVLLFVFNAFSALVAGVLAYGKFQRVLDAKFAAFALQLTNVKSALVLDLADITHRLGTLETGQDEWTKTLRQRSHDQGNEINTILLRLDRLERPPVRRR